ncbi:CLUMA_CG011770, isoform A [Clunio marinus]|uniref:CLUMA_CG011770, isoform A n=1 Tax=Clunio marinus TaxID=568069 RepID=A0A1J1IFV0_9DIPT|nr:CLUMA_CG011770, isoform A [Clunio marinus]
MERKQSWYIPRPSLSSTSNSHTNRSNDSIRCYHRDSAVIDIEHTKEKKSSTKAAATSSSSSTISSQRSKNKSHMETCIDGECESPKRGSRSSQGSSDSEQSIHSASSLLLTVANLENFAKIQDQTRNHHINFHQHNLHLSGSVNDIAKTHNKSSSVINIHPNNLLSPPHLKPTKELDQLSTASSTHFTMVNGFGRSNMKRNSSYICKRSRQVSVLIITMSVLFLIGISTAVVLLESKCHNIYLCLNGELLLQLA